MEALPKADTVKQWIRDFKQVREKGRQKVHSAIRYGAVLQPVERSYKDQSKRHHEGDSYRSDTSRQESKRQKRIQLKLKDSNDTGRKAVDWTIVHCDTCGMQGHETSKCWLDIPPAHSDRNIETIAFELSTKGKQWALNPKGPYCPAKW